VRSPRRSPAAQLIFPAVPAPDWEKPNMSADEPYDPLAALRVPPTAHQVIEFIYEEIEHAISEACSADELAVVAQLLEKAQAAAERILADRGGAPLVPRFPYHSLKAALPWAARPYAFAGRQLRQRARERPAARGLKVCCGCAEAAGGTRHTNHHACIQKKPDMASEAFNAALREAGFGVARGRIVDVSGRCPGVVTFPTFRGRGGVDRNATLAKAKR